MLKFAVRSLLGLLALFAVTLPGLAQRASHTDMVDRINRNTVMIITGTPAGTYLTIGYDMSSVLDDEAKLRVVPMVGKGSVQNVHDILFLRGVDMGIVQSDVLTGLKQTGELGSDIDQRVNYIAKLYNEEFHLVVNKKINDVKELVGQKVNFAEVNSGTQFSARIIFNALGIKVQEVNMGQADGLLKVKSGEIAATVFIVGRPAAVLAKLSPDPDLKLLPVPYTQALEDSGYLPATLTSGDYPALIPEGQKVNTIAVGAVLAVYNWPPGTERHGRVSRFIDAFFSRFAELQKPPRHPKWKDVNLATTLKGWRRFAPAQAWIDKARLASATSSGAGIDVDPALARKQAQEAAPGDPAKQRELFRQFLEWAKRPH